MTVFLAISGAIALAACQWLIYCYAPLEVTMGLVQKIFYIHLPLAWWALISFFLAFAGSVAYLWKRNVKTDNFCAACVEVGALFSALALATGMIWAKKSWGVWWTWDPRLSTTLIMLFIYAAYLVLRNMDMPAERKRTVCAVVGIAAFLDVPLVFVSARIFRSIHPAVFASKGGGLEPEMLITVLCCMAGMGLLWAALISIRKKQLDAETKWEKVFLASQTEDGD